MNKTLKVLWKTLTALLKTVFYVAKTAEEGAASWREVIQRDRAKAIAKAIAKAETKATRKAQVNQ